MSTQFLTNSFAPLQPYSISGWHLTQIKHQFDVILGKMLQNEPISPSDTEVSYLKAQHVQWEQIILDDLPTMWANPKEITDLTIKEGDLLVCEGGEVGRASIVSITPEQECIIQNALHLVRSKHGNDLRFLKYFLVYATTQGWIDVLCNRATIAHFTAEKFKNMWLWIPMASEQTHIADFLDHETSKIDTLIAELDDLLKLVTEKRQATISHAVTRGINPDVPLVDSGVDWIGEIPVGWQTVKLKQIVSFISGGTPSKSRSDYWEGNIPWVSPKDMKSIDISSSEDSITEEALRESSTSLIQSNSVLVVVRSGILKHTLPIGVNILPVAINQDIKGLVPKLPLNTKWLALVLKGFERHILDVTYQMGATVDSLNSNLLGNFYIPVPPIEEQQEIVSLIDGEITKLDELKKTIQETIQLLQERRSALIAAAVTGKIRVTE